MVKVVVPVSGPCSDATPRRTKEQFPTTIRPTAVAKLKPNPMSSAP